MSRPLLLLLSVVVLVVATGLSAWYDLEQRQQQIELLLRDYTPPERTHTVRVKVVDPGTGKTTVYNFHRRREESMDAFLQRVKSAEQKGLSTLTGIICTTLTDCASGNEYEVCTPCGPKEDRNECEDMHVKDVELACQVFECDCP